VPGGYCRAVLGWAVSVLAGEDMCYLFLLLSVFFTGAAEVEVHGILYNVRVRLGGKPPEYTLRYISGGRPGKQLAPQCCSRPESRDVLHSCCDRRGGWVAVVSILGTQGRHRAGRKAVGPEPARHYRLCSVACPLPLDDASDVE